MLTDTFPPAEHLGYAGRPVTKAPNWHALVACDMLFNNLSTGLFLVAATGELAVPAVFGPLTIFAYPAALLFLLADLLCLVLDLGDPWRFHHMLRVFKPSSPMSLGTWCLTAFSLPLTAAAALALLPTDGPALEWGRKLAAIVAIPPAVGVALYKGVLFSTTAQPGWKDMRWLGGYLANSAVLLGTAGLLAVALVTDHASAAAVLRTAAMPLLLLNAATLSLVLLNARTTLRMAYRKGGWNRVIVSAVGGVAVPLVLLAVGGAVPMVTAVLLILADAVGVRFEIVRLPHVVGSPAEPPEV